jgi:membrane fusion protein (multidrug efflux system)
MDNLINQLEQAAKAQTKTPDSGVTPPPPAPANGTKAKLGLVLGGTALVLIAVATLAYFHYRDRVSTDDAQVDAHVAPIAPRIAGSVAAILVDDDQQVKAGDVLVQIDPRDYQARVDQARAAVAAAQAQSRGADVRVPLTSETTSQGTAAAEAQLAAAGADYQRAKFDAARAASSELAYARADVEAKRAMADRARADLARMEPLVAKDEITRLQFDAYTAAARVTDSELAASREKLSNVEKLSESAQAAAQAAEARMEQARAALDQAHSNRKQVAISSAQAGSASAAILEARAALEAAELQLSYTTITAPIDGVVTRKQVQLGQIIQPGQSLLTIVPLREIWITANFKETQLANARPGQRAEVYVDMYGRSFEGRLASVASATGAKLSLLPPENATGNYVKIVQRIPVKILLENVPAGYTFRPGMNVDATLFTR